MNARGDLLGPHSALSSLCPACQEEETGPEVLAEDGDFSLARQLQFQLLGTAEFCTGWWQPEFDLVPLGFAAENEPHLSRMGILFSL